VQLLFPVQPFLLKKRRIAKCSVQPKVMAFLKFVAKVARKSGDKGGQDFDTVREAEWTDVELRRVF